MIRQVESVLNDGEFLCGYLRGYYEAYGAARPFLRFYGDDSGGQLSLMDGVATVCWHKNVEELALFLSAQQDLHTIRSAPAVAAALAEDGDTLTVRPIMKCETPLKAIDETTSPSPRVLHPFLARIFSEMSPFEQWYVDVSHRVRHGCCHISAVEKEGVVLASAMTVAEWKNGAVIGAVATDPVQRRQGYAARCVTNLTAALQAVGKEVYICPKNDGAQRLYERLGFVVCGETAILERN